MALTVSNINSMQLVNILGRTSKSQANLMRQLSTGSRINRGADDPAGLIALENFNSELTRINAAVRNNERADAVLSTADAGLTEVSSLLTDIESLVIASAGNTTLSQAEINANQLQIDDALSAIDRIVNTTTFNGDQLLNGAQAINRTGITADTVENLQIFSRGPSSSNFSVTTLVKSAATQATGTIDLDPAAALTEQSEVLIAGPNGSTTVTLANGDTKAQIASKINDASDVTGVTATVDGDDVDLATSLTGSAQSLEVTVVSGGTTDVGPNLADIAKTTGSDAVVTVNGSEITADGQTVSYSANGYSIAFDLGSDLDAPADTETFSISASGGLTFQLGSSASSRSTIGIDSLTTAKLGGGDAGAVLSDIKSGGSADLRSDSANTLAAVRKAIGQVAQARGRVGGFQRYQVQPSINSFSKAAESISAARSSLADTDYASATADLNRQNILLNAGVSLLAIANQQGNSILSLLGLGAQGN